MGELGHAVALLWLEHAPSISLAIGPRHFPLTDKKTVKKVYTLTLH